MKYCEKCGKEINNDAVICIHCGCEVKQVNKKNEKKAGESKKNSKGNIFGLIICCLSLYELAVYLLGWLKYGYFGELLDSLLEFEIISAFRNGFIFNNYLAIICAIFGFYLYKKD